MTVDKLGLGQRGKLEKLMALPPSDTLWRLILCLRLAALLHRSRDDYALPDFRASHSVSGFQFELPGEWLVANPLTAAALFEETFAWQSVGSGLRIKRRPF